MPAYPSKWLLAKSSPVLELLRPCVTKQISNSLSLHTQDMLNGCTQWCSARNRFFPNHPCEHSSAEKNDAPTLQCVFFEQKGAALWSRSKTRRHCRRPYNARPAASSIPTVYCAATSWTHPEAPSQVSRIWSPPRWRAPGCREGCCGSLDSGMLCAFSRHRFYE